MNSSESKISGGNKWLLFVYHRRRYSFYMDYKYLLRHKIHVIQMHFGYFFSFFFNKKCDSSVHREVQTFSPGFT